MQTEEPAINEMFIEEYLGIWRGNPRPFNDRDESTACFFSKPRAVSGLEFFVFRKTELSETERAVMIRVRMALLIFHKLLDFVNLKFVCELAIHAVSTIQIYCHLMSFLQFNRICTILYT